MPRFASSQDGLDEAESFLRFEIPASTGFLQNLL
jgi:hypothetical protein